MSLIGFLSPTRPARPTALTHGAVRKTFRGASCCLILGGALAFGLPAGLGVEPATAQELQAPPSSGLPGSFADLSDILSPAVVNISTAQMLEAGPGIGEGSPLEDLFRDLYPEDGGKAPRRVQSLGSGFVIDPSGIVVTNNHVILDADEITVTFPDGLTLEAEVVGVDPQTDVAVVKISHDEPLPYVSFADSDKARVGDWVLAIGNPFGFSGSVSAGIISARNRDINAGPYDDFIQTDAAINRGNSGGPLFNMEGEVVGVNTAIISPTGGSIGIGFSVPSNLVKRMVAQLQEFGAVRRGWLGVRVQTVNDELADALGLARPEGALVAEVTPGGPADQAGIEPGDVIIDFDGQPVREMRDLPRMVADTTIDESVPITIIRDGEEMALEAMIGLLTEEGEPAPLDISPEDAPETVEFADLGLSISTLSDLGRAEYGIPEGVTGVLVVTVAAGGQAAEKGLGAGDVIVEAGQKSVESPEEVEAIIEAARAAGRRSVLFLVHSRGELRFVPLTLGSD